jgi:hypothetical protein
MWVPFTFTSQKREVSDGIPTSAAVWIITSQPAAARCHSHALRARAVEMFAKYEVDGRMRAEAEYLRIVATRAG